MNQTDDNKTAEGGSSPLASSVSFDVDYFSRGQRTHGYRETWERLHLFCPNCGKKAVWNEMGEGDYYVGTPFLCGACCHQWYMPGGITDKSEDEQGKQRLAWISQNTQAQATQPE